MLAGLAAVAVLVVVGGLAFDIHANRAHSQCLDEEATIIRTLTPPQPPDPSVIESWVFQSSCEDATRGGLVVFAVGLVMFVATAATWLLRRSAAARPWLE